MSIGHIIVIGSMKCGTTSLHFILRQHEEIAGSNPKELNVFTRGVDPNAYVGHFPICSGLTRYTLESSPAYTKANVFKDDVDYSIPKRIEELPNQARLIYHARSNRADLRLAFCWSHGRRNLIKAAPKKGSPIVDEALLRIAALYKIEDAIRGADPDHRRTVRQELSRPLVDEFFTWLEAQAARVSRKSDLGEAMAYMLRRKDGFRRFLHDGHIDMDSNLVENAIRSPAMNRRNALFAGHDEGGRNWARFASLIGTCKMNGVEPYAYLRDLFTKLANGHLDKDIDALMPWAYAAADKASQRAHPGVPAELIMTLMDRHSTRRIQPAHRSASPIPMGRGRRLL